MYPMHTFSRATLINFLEGSIGLHVHVYLLKLKNSTLFSKLYIYQLIFTPPNMDQAGYSHPSDANSNVWFEGHFPTHFCKFLPPVVVYTYCVPVLSDCLCCQYW